MSNGNSVNSPAHSPQRKHTRQPASCRFSFNMVSPSGLRGRFAQQKFLPLPTHSGPEAKFLALASAQSFRRVSIGIGVGFSF